MDDQQRPQLTPNAEKLLEAYKKDISLRITHEAEKYALNEELSEISEGNIKKAIKSIPKLPMSKGKRKWLMIIGTGLIFTLLLSLFPAFSELPNIPPILLIRLALPTVAAMIWVLLVSYVFHEDWL